MFVKNGVNLVSSICVYFVTKEDIIIRESSPLCATDIITSLCDQKARTRVTTVVIYFEYAHVVLPSSVIAWPNALPNTGTLIRN